VRLSDATARLPSGELRDCRRGWLMRRDCTPPVLRPAQAAAFRPEKKTPNLTPPNRGSAGPPLRLVCFRQSPALRSAVRDKKRTSEEGGAHENWYRHQRAGGARSSGFFGAGGAPRARRSRRAARLRLAVLAGAPLHRLLDVAGAAPAALVLRCE